MACKHPVSLQTLLSLIIFPRLRLMLQHLLLVSFSLKFSDHVENISRRLLAGTAWVSSNKHVVRDKGPPRDHSAEQVSEICSDWP